MKFAIKLKPSKGEILHRAVLETDQSNNIKNNYYTSAVFHSPYDIKSKQVGGVHRVKLGESARVGYKVIVCDVIGGKNFESIADLKLSSDLNTKWNGDFEKKKLGDNVFELSRSLDVIVGGLNEVGSQARRLDLLLNNSVVATEVVQWENYSNFECSPDKLILSGTKGEAMKLVVRCSTGRSFQIKSVLSDIVGIEASLQSSGDKKFHAVMIETKNFSSKDTRYGELVVKLSDPDTEIIKVPILIIP